MFGHVGSDSVVDDDGIERAKESVEHFGKMIEWNNRLREELEDCG